MDFDLSEEDTALRDSVSRWVQQRYPFARRRELAASAAGFSAEHWREMAHLGWLALPFDESLGGLGGGALATALLMEELGRGLVLEPYLPTVLLFGGALARSATHREGWVPKLIDGSVQGAFATLERDNRHAPADVQTTLRPAGTGFVLNGHKALVLNGAAAQHFVVSVRCHGGRFDEAGIDLVLVAADAPGLQCTPVTLMDGQRAANLQFHDVPVQPSQRLFEAGEGFAPMQATLHAAMLALCAEGVGVMGALFDSTLDYVKTRKQFGVPIGSFQVLQHRLVDMHMALEQTRSLLVRALCSADAHDADTQRDLLALKVMVGRSGRLIGGEAIQMHGGMGMTDELPIGHGVKRLTVIDSCFGDAEAQRRRFSDLVSA